MADDINNDLPVAEPVVAGETKLDSILNEGLADYGEDTSTQRARDEAGRFAKQELAAETSDKEPVDAAKPATEQPAIDPALQPVDPPARWSEADKAKFVAWPRDVQEAVVDRHKAMEADYTRKSQDLSEYRKSADPLVQAVQPFQQYLSSLNQQIGLSTGQMIHGMLTLEYGLRTGTAEQKVQALSSLASEYGIDLAAMSRGEGAQPNPMIDQLRQQVMSVTQELNQIKNQSQAQVQRQVSEEVSAFENAKNTDGSLKYPHFQMVKGVIGQLIGTGQAETLEAAYEKATAPISEAVAAELSKRQSSSEQQDRSAVEKARRAAPVRSNGTAPNGHVKKGLDGILDDALTAAGYN